MTALSFELRRFTLEEHERGKTHGWCFHCGWFVRASGLTWAWFQKEVEDGETIEQP